MYAIETKNLTKTFKERRAVDEVNFTVDDGEMFALLGVNGAGKTTTINMLCCLIKATTGDAFIYGESVSEQPIKVKQLINVSPQETAVADNLTVRENLELIARLHGFSKQDAKQKATDLMERFGLSDRAKDKAKKLSGGLGRRLSIAMALISEPKVIFLDEPTLGLDVIARRELWKFVKQLKGKITIVLTTHYLEEAEALCDRIAVMHDGKLVAIGTVAELIEQTGESNFENAFIKLSGVEV